MRNLIILRKKISATCFASILICVFCLCGILFSEEVQADVSGECGLDVSWELIDGKLSISGSGSMNNFTEQEMAPWYNNRNDIISIYVEDGITDIGKLSFYGCENLEYIQLPDSIKKINDYAFSGCKKLSAVYLSDKLKVIGDYAFESCQSLSTIILPKNLTELGYHAFYRCESLISITIPYTVSNMGNGVFAHCSNLIQVNIESNINKIPAWTFYGCTSLVTISLPENIKEIDYYAFNRCESLSFIYHPGTEGEKESIIQQVKESLPDFSGSVSSDISDTFDSSWNGSETDYSGTVNDIQKEVVDSENATIQSMIEYNKPTSGTDNVEFTIDASIKNDAGWNEVINRIDALVKNQDIYENENTTVGTIIVNVQVKDNVVIKSNVLSKWAGERVQININTAEGTSWSIRGEDLETETLSGKYELSFKVTKNEDPTKAQKKVIGDSVSYLLEFEDELPFKVTVNVPLPIEHARDYATLYQKPLFKGWEEVQTVVVDDAGKACFNLQGVDGKTKYLIGINVPGAGKGGAIIPESLYDDYGGLTDSNGVHYEITGTRSSIGISFTQLTLILLGIVVVSAVIVGIIVRMFAKAKYRGGVVAKSKSKDAEKKSK